MFRFLNLLWGTRKLILVFFIEILHPVFGHPGFHVQSTEFLSVFLRAHPCLIAHKIGLNMCFLSRVCYFDISWDALCVMWWMGFKMNHTTVLNIRCLMSHQPWNPVCLVFFSSFTCRTKESVWSYSWQSSWMLIMVSKENWRKFPTSGKTRHASQRKLNSG